MANRVSLKTLYNLNKSTGEPFLGNVETLQTLPFMAEYLVYFSKIDRRFMRSHKSFCPTWNLQEEDTSQDVLDAFKDNVDDLLVTNKESYKRMWDLFITEYLPLENYNRIEKTKDTNSGADTITDDMGLKKRIDNIGEVNGITTYGELNSSDTIGSQTSKTINSQSGFNGSDLVDVSGSNVTNGERIDGHHEDQKIDKNKIDARTDISTEDGYTDIHTTDFGHVIEHENNTHGNIGVTTSQQMATSEVDFWTAYNFYKVILNDIIRELCNLFDEGFEAFSSDYGEDITVDPVIDDKPVVDVYYKLTVIDKYVSNNKLTTYDTVERSVEEFKSGSAYNVNALTIDGYTADVETQTGTIESDTTITFVYVANSDLTKVSINVYDKYGDFLQLRETKEYDIGSQYTYASYIYPVGFEKIEDSISGIAYLNNQNVYINYNAREKNTYTLNTLLNKIGIADSLETLCDNAKTIFGSSQKRGQTGIVGFINYLLQCYNTGLVDSVYVTPNCRPWDRVSVTGDAYGTLYSFMIPLSSETTTQVTNDYTIVSADTIYSINAKITKPAGNSIYSPLGNVPFSEAWTGERCQFYFPFDKGWINKNGYYICYNIIVRQLNNLNYATNTNENYDNQLQSWTQHGNNKGSHFCDHDPNTGTVIESSVIRL